VGVLSGRLDPSSPMSCLFVLAPFVLRSWHDKQLRELSCDKRESPNSRSPSLVFRGSIGGGSGIGVIGSSAMMLPDSSGWTSCDGTAERGSPPKISMLIAIAGHR
jgi:hypothetical protein